MKGKMESSPTGCFKCGRPGHWSRDCPSDPKPNPNPNSGLKPSGSGASKKAPKTRPKLTPELILSDDGLGFVLRHFPTNFKYRGQGHEVSDLANLIGLYTDWHSHLLPYYSFDQFVHKAEQVTSTKRVKTCLRDLRERVARGGDPTKLHEPPVVSEGPNYEQDVGIPLPDEFMSEGMNPEPQAEPPSKNHVDNDNEEDMLHEIYERAIEEADQTVGSSEIEALKQVKSNRVESSSEDQITEEQKARMEANRMKAVERAAARSRLSQPT